MKFLRCNQIKWIGALGLSSLLMLSCDRLELERSQRATETNEQGVTSLEGGNIPEAQRLFMESLALEPTEGAYQLNLGYSFEIAKRPDEALKAYESLRKEDVPSDLRFFAAFNSGRIYGEAKEYDKAFAAYQEALDTAPSSELAQEVKVNIELLAQQQQQEQKQQDGEGESEEKKDSESQGDQEQEKKDQQGENDEKKEEPKEYQNPKDQKQQKQKFKSKELNENDVRRIFEELTRQEQKIRAEYNREETKEENTNEKDW